MLVNVNYFFYVLDYLVYIGKGCGGLLNEMREKRGFYLFVYDKNKYLDVMFELI